MSVIGPNEFKATMKTMVVGSIYLTNQNGRSALSDMIKSLTYGFTGDIPHFFSNMFTAVGRYIFLHIYVDKIEEKEKKNN